MKRTLIYALEGESQAQERLEALKTDGRMAGRRNAELWEGNVEPARAVVVFPCLYQTAIAEAYKAAGIDVEVVQNEKIKQEVGGQAEGIQADEGQNDQAEKGRTRRVSK